MLDLYNWGSGNTTKLKEVWKRKIQFFVPIVEYLVLNCIHDNDKQIRDELVTKEERLYQFESVDTLSSRYPGLSQASDTWKYNKWMTEFETNSELRKVLIKNVFMIPNF